MHRIWTVYLFPVILLHIWREKFQESGIEGVVPKKVVTMIVLTQCRHVRNLKGNAYGAKIVKDENYERIFLNPLCFPVID